MLLDNKNPAFVKSWLSFQVKKCFLDILHLPSSPTRVRLFLTVLPKRVKTFGTPRFMKPPASWLNLHILKQNSLLATYSLQIGSFKLWSIGFLKLRSIPALLMKTKLIFLASAFTSWCINWCINSEQISYWRCVINQNCTVQKCPCPWQGHELDDL